MLVILVGRVCVCVVVFVVLDCGFGSGGVIWFEMSFVFCVGLWFWGVMVVFLMWKSVFVVCFCCVGLWLCVWLGVVVWFEMFLFVEEVWEWCMWVCYWGFEGKYVVVLYGVWWVVFVFDVGGWIFGVLCCVLCCVVLCVVIWWLLRVKSCWSCGGFGGGGERERERRCVLLVMGIELVFGIVCCVFLCGSFGVFYYVVLWE